MLPLTKMSKFLFFVLLYFVQGVALAYFTGFQKRFLLEAGVDPNWIAALTSFVLLPFILKPIIGLVADSFNVSRKLCIAIGLGSASFAFSMALGVSPKEQFTLFGALMVLASLGVSLFDTVADALAVDSFDDKDFGKLQSAMLAGKSLGLIIFSIIFGLMIDSSGYDHVFVFLSGFMLIPFVIWKSIKKTPRKETFEWAAFAALAQKHVILIALFAVVYSIPSFAVSGLYSFYFSSQNMSATDVGVMESIKSIGAVLGALGFMFLSRKLSQSIIFTTSALGAVVVSCASGFAYGSMAWVIVFLFGVFWAIREAIFSTLAMRATKPAIAATMFSLMMAFSNLGTSIGEGLATSASGAIGFKETFVVFGLLNLVVFAFYRMFKV